MDEKKIDGALEPREVMLPEDTEDIRVETQVRQGIGATRTITVQMRMS